MRHSSSLLLPSVKLNAEKQQSRKWYPRNFPIVKDQIFDRNRLRHLKINRQFKKFSEDDSKVDYQVPLVCFEFTGGATAFINSARHLQEMRLIA